MLVTIVLPATALAGSCHVPPSFSDPIFVTCPAGDVRFRVRALTFAYDPGHNVTVVVYWNSPSFRLDGCAPPCLASPTQRSMTVVTDVSGWAYFDAKAGGICQGPFYCQLDGRPLPPVPGAPLDQDGDLVVTYEDLERVRSLLGTSDPTADFDADGMVTEADLTFQRAHLYHAPEQPTAARSGTWGAIKAIYR